MSFLAHAGRAAALTILTVAVLAGCVRGPAESETGDARGTDPRAAVAEESSTPGEGVNILDTPVTLTDGVFVDSACFDFTVLDYGDGWELRPNPTGCVADIRWPGSDELTTILVRPQTGDASLDVMRSTLDEGGAVLVDEQEFTVDGLEAYSVWFDDGSGLEKKVTIIHLPEGHFNGDGEPITSIFISGYSYNEEMEAMVDSVVESFDVH